MKKIKEILHDFLSERSAVFAIIRLLIYPATQLIITPLRLANLLWKSRKLFNGNWGDYSAFNPGNGFNHLFYWNRALNIYRYGREGKSPYLGLGNYPLSRGFNYSLPSLYSFWMAPTITVLFGLFGWLFLHMLWINQVQLSWLVICIFITLISTQFYINLGKQNYHAFGWMFFPVFIFGLVNQMWLIAAVGFLLASFGSITFVFIGSILLISASIINQSYLPLAAAIPAYMNLITQVYPLFTQDDSSNIVKTMMKAIGLSAKKTKYKRTVTKRLGIFFFYYLFLYLQFLFVAYTQNGTVDIYFGVGIFIFIINALIFRFADTQTIWMLLCSIALPVLIMNEFNAITLASFWLMVSPLPITADFNDGTSIDTVKKLEPFNIARYTPIMKDFFKEVKRNERVLFCFEDPEDIYEKIFDGYRKLLELPFYFALKSEFLLLPDWWAVFELNYPGAPNIWGRNVETVKKNIEKWSPDFIIVYQKSGTTLDEIWDQNNFTVCSELDWREIEENFGYSKFYKPESPKWWLLRIPKPAA